MLNAIKKAILGTVWPLGKKAKILRGPLKGARFKVSKNSGWSPIVGRWEPESQLLFVNLIKPGWTVYDLGANNGIHTMLFSQLVGAKGKVYSFEPLQDNCNEIQENIAINNINNVQIVPKAVSDVSGETVFHLGLHDKQGSLVGIGLESGKDIKVTMITLDEFIKGGNPAPDFLKIDIEGAESMALLGYTEQILNKKPFLFVELHTPEQDGKVGAFLLQKGYDVYRITDKHVDGKPGIQGLERIKDLTKTFPHPDGIWGTVLAIHNTRLNELVIS